MAAALALAGCSQNEIMEQNPDANAPIGFGVYTGVQTRGLVTDNTNTDGVTANGLKVGGKGFGIQAYLTAGDYTVDAAGIAKTPFMTNQHVTWNSTDAGAWEYSPVKFWPDETKYKVSFFAYAPYDANATTATESKIKLTDATATANPTLTFELTSDEQKNMVDLMVSDPNYTTGSDNDVNKTLNLTKTSEKVTFKFKHALSKVTMKARPSVDISNNSDTKVYITGVSIAQNSILWKKAVLDMNTLTWAATPTSATYLASSADYALASGTNTGNGVLNLTTITSFKTDYNTPAIDISGGYASSSASNAVSLFISDHYLFFIPVDGTTGTAETSPVSVKISYDILTKASEGNIAVSSATQTVKLPTGSFAQGKAYAYTFVIGLDEIKVDVATDILPWEDVTTGEINVPEIVTP